MKVSKFRKFTKGEISQVLSLATELYVSDEKGDWDEDDCLRIARKFVARSAAVIDEMNDGDYMICDLGLSWVRVGGDEGSYKAELRRKKMVNATPEDWDKLRENHPRLVKKWEEFREQYPDMQVDDVVEEVIDADDPVYNPSHYNTGGVECIEGIESSMPEAAFSRLSKR